MLKLLYIAGCTHCGSTLLNRVLGAHPKAITLGSTKKLPVILAKDTPCACGAARLQECEFWGAVDRELRQRGKSLTALDVHASSQLRFVEDNRDLYEAVVAVSGAEVIVESSRRSSRLRRLRTIPGLEVIPIHLYKTPLAQAGSWKRKGQRLIQFVPGYWARNARILAACRHDPARLMLSYEQFCRDPELELQRIFSAAGLEYDEQVLNSWGEAPIHTLGGNRMKRGRSSKIVLDEGWREHLSSVDIHIMKWTCNPLWRRMEARRTDPEAVEKPDTRSRMTDRSLARSTREGMQETRSASR